MMMQPTPRRRRKFNNSELCDKLIQAWRGYRIRRIVGDMIYARAEDTAEVGELAVLEKTTV